MKKLLTNEDLHTLLTSVNKMQDELHDINRRTTILQSQLKNYFTAFDFENSKNRENYSENLKFDSIRLYAELKNFFSKREKILHELKESYKEIFLRDMDYQNLNAIYSENKFMLSQMA